MGVLLGDHTWASQLWLGWAENSHSTTPGFLGSGALDKAVFFRQVCEPMSRQGMTGMSLAAPASKNGTN